MTCYINKSTFEFNIYMYSVRAIHFYSTNTNVSASTKHYPPANKEWKDSIYSYDKNYLKHLPVNGRISDNVIVSHFHLNNLNTKIKSKHMRDSIIHKSNKKIYVSKPRVKHTSDKAIISLYTFNRQKEFFMRKLYFYKRNYNLFNSWIIGNLVNKIRVKQKINISKRGSKQKINILRKKLKKMHFSRILKKQKRPFTNMALYEELKRKKRLRWYNKNKLLKIRFPVNNMSYKNELDFIRYKTSNFYKKILYFNNIFIFVFFRKLLYLLGIDLFMPIHIKTSSSSLYIKNYLTEVLNKEPDKLMWLNKKSNRLCVIDKNSVNIDVIVGSLSNYKYNDLILLNKYILCYIENKFVKTGLITYSYIINTYIKFKAKYYDKLLFEFFGDKPNIINLLKKLELNTLKYTRLLYNIKILMTRLYNKKVELNITNLKYPFLNSDIYTKIIIKKAATRMGLSRLLKSSLSLSKIPKEILLPKSNDIKTNNKNKTSDFNEDKLTYFIENLYPDNMVYKRTTITKHKKNKNNKLTDILNTIKYKWVAGVWLQGTGRITRRFTASRSAFKAKCKGSLKNERYYFDNNNKIRAASTLVIRNTIKSNSQYTFMKSKRRIGSFGIKSWISSY